MLEERLQIRYVDLTFMLEIERRGTLPRNKVSALRGGLGQMLLEQNCIRDRKCDACDFEKECLVRRTIYSKYDIQPTFANHGNSIGYVIECENLREQFEEGERLYFHLLLFGKTIMYFSQFLQGFYMLGQQGLGKEHIPYQILQVRNEQGVPVVNGYQVDLQKLGITTIDYYVKNRLREFPGEKKEYTLKFQSPVSIKHDGNFIREFSAEAIARSSLRRVFNFDCFEGIEVEYPELDDMPETILQSARPVSVRRVSSNSGKMELHGILGELTMGNVSEELLCYLLACEKLHIGKNTSFGFGRYVMH